MNLQPRCLTIIHKLHSLHVGNTVQMDQQVQFTTGIQLDRLIFPLTLQEQVQDWLCMACSNAFCFAGEGAIPYIF